MASVTLDHVTKRFGDVVAVGDLSIKIADGEFVVLVGPSGCGKTTVLRLIAGLEVPDDGEILIDGQIVNRSDPSARNVAMVFEDYALYPHLAVRENLDFPLRLRRRPAEEIRRRVSAVAASMQVGGLLERKPRELAAGEAQHVAIGHALVREAPTVFLLDDALSHLDARQRLEGRAELARLHQDSGATIVAVTHDQAEALALGTRVAVMDEGRLHQAAPPRTLYEHPADVFVAGFIGSPPMNLVEMTVEPDGDHPVLRAGSFVLPAPDGAVASLPYHVTVGIRPEDIEMDPPPDGETGFRARCDLVEYLGHQVLAHLRVGDVELLAFDDPARHLRAGDIVDGAIALDRSHLFDSRTGRSLARP
jgi:multiple sugar transport system ATP-binding protein